MTVQSRLLHGVLAGIVLKISLGAEQAKAPFKNNQYYSAVCDSKADCVLYEGKDVGGSHAYAMYNDDVMVDGWGKIWVHGDKTSNGWFEAGFLEGALTSQRIFQHFNSWYAHQFPSPPSAETKEFLVEQYLFAKKLSQQVASNDEDAKYYTRLGQVLSQYDGMVKGMSYGAIGTDVISGFELLMLEAAGDLYDIIPATTPSEFKLNIGKLTAAQFEEEWHKVVSCSAMIKINSDLSDVFVGHTTWTSYTGMLRIFKNYNLDGGEYQMSFSAKPGSIYSKDDFYVLPHERQQLVVLETTNGILNADIYKKVTYKSLLTWQRMPLTNSIATNGPEWVELFSKYQSGTYVNQYMVVDMKKFIPSVGPQKGFLWIAEVIPGNVFSGDVTEVLKAQGNYWPSYNIPYFKDNWIITGYQTAYETYGDAYSYDNCTRALMMRRDHKSINTLSDIGHLLRQNNFKTDVYANGDPANAISTRKDLKATSAQAFGGIDSKITSFTKVTKPFSTGGQSLAQSGPTHDNADLPPFQWSKFNSTEDHGGQPDIFNFDFVEMNLYEH